MTYTVELTERARKHFYALPKKEQGRIRKTLLTMEREPFAGDVVKLSGHNAYRKRTGNYRIIFTCTGGALTVLVLDILRRNERTYKNLA